jgi:uncharacterized protein involved in exopolysaccharide biosynthesis
MDENNLNKGDIVNNQLNSGNLIFFLLKYSKPLIIVAISAAIVSSVVALLIPPKYKSTAVFFPAHNSSLSKGIMTQDSQAKNDITTLGAEDQAEAMLQLLNSDRIKYRIWKKFGLMQHYDIDPDERFANTELQEMWEDNVSFRRTEFNSIKIEVLDRDSIMAADLANAIAALVDSIRNEMVQTRANEALKVVENEYSELQEYIQTLDDSLTFIRKKGVHTYERQAERLVSIYYQAIADNDSRTEAIMQSKLDTIAEYGSSYMSMSQNLGYLRGRLMLLKSKYDELKVDATQSISWKFMVNYAVPSEKKAYPIRWLIVVVSTFSAIVLAIIAILILENLKRFSPSSREQ